MGLGVELDKIGGVCSAERDPMDYIIFTCFLALKQVENLVEAVLWKFNF